MVKKPFEPSWMSKWALGFHFAAIQWSGTFSMGQIPMNLPIRAYVFMYSMRALILEGDRLMRGWSADLAKQVLVLGMFSGWPEWPILFSSLGSVITGDLAPDASFCSYVWLSFVRGCREGPAVPPAAVAMIGCSEPKPWPELSNRWWLGLVQGSVRCFASEVAEPLQFKSPKESGYLTM